MALEIARKFLVCEGSWRRAAQRSIPIRQGYLFRTPLLRGRIRIFGDKAYLTLKSQPGTMRRYEFEYEIPTAGAKKIITRFGIEPIITKTRHKVPHEGLLWVVDVFEGANEGLVMAEVELEHEEQSVVIPTWAGVEVTGDRRFGNSNLARYPFASWNAKLS
jgi:adenylate cyclase